MRKIHIAILIILFVLLGFVLAETQKYLKPVVQDKINASRQGKANLTIDFGNNSQDFELDLKNEATALDLLKDSKLEVGSKQYDFGTMIESINGVENGEGGKYWIYYVNGQTPMVSADKYNVKSGDKVEFKFESSPF